MRHFFSLIVVGFSLTLIISSCGNNNSQDETNTRDEVIVEKRNMGNDSTGIAMAFYYQDSIATQFRFYREVDSMLKAKELEFQKELERRIRSYQAYEADIQKRMERNEITGYQIEEIQQTAMQKQQAIQLFEQQRGGEIQREIMQYQMALMNKISESGKEFSNSKNIDLLFFYQKGGQITFINNAYDVTADFIDYLNKREDELKLGFEDELEGLEDADFSTGGLD
ncbi:MAG TPA: OmpH family outer membrane protein [Brumimicrobium sp.]|nr:OmpH family outer membrane protein [Brumimicrobium sp.]